MYPELFDTSKLTDSERQILSDFAERRKIFDAFLKENLDVKFFTCPCCGYPTLEEIRCYEICKVCNWEDEDQDDPNADEILGGANGNESLTEARLRIGKEIGNIVVNSGAVDGDLGVGSVNQRLNLNPKEVLAILSSMNREDKILENLIKKDAKINK